MQFIMLSKKLIFKFLVYCCFLNFVFCFNLLAQSKSDLNKIKDYQKGIIELIKEAEEKKKSTFEILELIEKNIKEGNKQILLFNHEISILAERKKKLEEELAIINNKLDKIIEGIYKKYLLIYILKRVKETSIIPSLIYLKNYQRNNSVISLILEKDIELELNLTQLVNLQKKQILKVQKTKIQLETSIVELETNNQQQQFNKQQQQIFLEQVKKQQLLNQKTLQEIEANLVKLGTYSAGAILNKDRQLPAKGELVYKFGIQDPKITFYHKNGILINTIKNSAVKSVSSGKVVYIDKVARYNYLMIIQHSAKNFSIYGRLNEIYAKEGDLVKTQQKIATVSNYTHDKNLLYFAIRSASEPFDPLKWLSDGFIE